MTSAVQETVRRAALSHGSSADSILQQVLAGFDARGIHRGRLIDLGCGRGDLARLVADLFDGYLGVDVVPYDEWPNDVPFLAADLNAEVIDVAPESADVVTAVELIEHLENPRALFRMMVQLVRPGGWIVVTTPNQLSWLSKISLCLTNQFPAFKERPGLYPAHITAVLEVDLVRLAMECRLVDSQIAYSLRGRVPGTSRHYPRWLSRIFPRALSDNVLLFARKPLGESAA